MSKIGWGVVGYGVIGKNHARAAHMVPDAELVAVCDIDPKREKVLREHGFKAPFYT
ncbi:MAG: Gfo/Idh/MocA family oxidoreductase, partial [Lentisphaerae bacterium]|nr:Gfo/Idh/MocA family oxidoreductase [Lentisphaerota bacterium]